jgi:hypothetical protein
LKHDVIRHFSLFLLHRKWAIKPHETVVNVRATARIMKETDFNQLTNLCKKTMPMTWMIVEGEAQPIEFSVIGAR